MAVATSRAMVLDGPGRPLRLEHRALPEPGPGQVRVKVSACAVCRTDLHVVDGDLTEGHLPIVPGHEIVGRVDALGDGVSGLAAGQRVGIPWLGWTCGACRYCRAGQENLCPDARFTGYHIDGGFADHAVADARYCFPVGGGESDISVAPWLCAGLIGYRTLAMAGDAELLGLYGFGAAAHIVAQVLRHQGRRFVAITRDGDREAQDFARRLGAEWAGGASQRPPAELDAALIFAPVGDLVPAALAAIRPGGTVVCGGIHMSPLPSFGYDLLWRERCLRSVANLTRQDGLDFLALAPQVPVRAETQTFALEDADEALDRLRTGRLQGAAVLVP